MQTHIALMMVNQSMLIKAQGKVKTLPRMEHPSFPHRVNKYYHFRTNYSSKQEKEVKEMKVVTVICLALMIVLRVFIILIEMRNRRKGKKELRIWDNVLIILLCMDVILSRII